MGRKKKESKKKQQVKNTKEPKKTKEPNKNGGKITKMSLNTIEPSFWKHPGFRERAKGSNDPSVKKNIRAQFADPTLKQNDKGFIVIHKAALPNNYTLSSLTRRGSWCIIMSGGGNFCAAIWDTNGKKIQSKMIDTKAIAKNHSGGRGKFQTIRTDKAKNAGENVLQTEVRDLLLSWSADLKEVQCVFLHVNKKDRSSLLFWWKNSPLDQHERNCRDIPFPVKQISLAEMTKAYDKLSSVVFSPISLIPPAVPKEDEKVEPLASLSTKLEASCKVEEKEKSQAGNKRKSKDEETVGKASCRKRRKA